MIVAQKASILSLPHQISLHLPNQRLKSLSNIILTKREVQEFIRKKGWSLATKDDYKNIASILYKETGGDMGERLLVLTGHVTKLKQKRQV
jgi:hypothetical protein